MADTETGVVKTVERFTSEDGRIGLRAIVEFYDGNVPALTFNTVWNAIPVKIVPQTST